MKRLELEAIEAVDLTLSYSEVERGVIEAETLGQAATSACPWVVEGPEEPAPLAGRSGLAFLGSFNHPPNRDAVQAFLAELWPVLRQRQPHLELHLYGSGLARELADAPRIISKSAMKRVAAGVKDRIKLDSVIEEPAEPPEAPPSIDLGEFGLAAQLEDATASAAFSAFYPEWEAEDPLLPLSGWETTSSRPAALEAFLAQVEVPANDASVTVALADSKTRGGKRREWVDEC